MDTSIALTLVVAETAGDDGMDASGRPGSAVVRAGCGVAMLLVILAIVAVAQPMDLGNIVLAQQNTLPYALVEPVAALVFVVALAVLWSHRFVAKSVALVVAVLMLGRRLARPDERRRALAWRYLAPVALLNFIGTLVLVGRPQ
jgi:NADH:ubiquinone oxidoreductase subunit H